METVDKIYGIGEDVSDGVPRTTLDEIFGTGASSSSIWTRPSDWLTLPYVPPSEDKMVGLYAVFDTTSEFVAFTATGAFTVDWGDGSAVDNVASGVQAQHQYDYATISAGTLSSRGYKQVIITITPQAGQQLLSVSLDKRHTTASAQIQSSNWLDITCSCNSASTLGFSSAGTATRSRMLERATILNGGLRTSTASMFTYCSALRVVNLFDTFSVKNMEHMFAFCTSIQTIPLFNTALVSTMSNMLNGCASLTGVPLLNLISCTIINSLFQNCTALKEIPLLNTSNVTSSSSLCLGCSALQKFPAIDLSKTNSLAGAFNGCTALCSIPALNLISLTSDLSTTFSGCVDLARSLLINVSFDCSYANCNLSATALDEIYTNLPVVVGKTITVTGNYGVAADTPAIATGKGWAVVG